MATKLGRMMTYLNYLLPIKSNDLQSRDFVRPRDKIKHCISYYHNVFGHKQWQDDDLPLITSSIRSHDHITTWSYEIT